MRCCINRINDKMSDIPITVTYFQLIDWFGLNTVFNNYSAISHRLLVHWWKMNDACHSDFWQMSERMLTELGPNSPPLDWQPRSLPTELLGEIFSVKYQLLSSLLNFTMIINLEITLILWFFNAKYKRLYHYVWSPHS